MGRDTHLATRFTLPHQLDIRLELPARTIAKVLLTCFLVWAGLRLWPEFVLVLISILFAVSLYPGLTWLERRGLPRGAAIGLMALGTLIVFVTLVAVVMPPLGAQLLHLVGDFAAFRTQFLQRLPADQPFLTRVFTELLSLPSSPEMAAWFNRPLLWGRLAASGTMRAFFVLVLTFYFMIDGKRLYAWLLAFVPRAHRERMADTIPEVSDVVHAYIRGQVITSVLFGIFVAALLTILGVPAVVPLAVLAAICDVIPVVGIILAIVPAALLAVSVSLTTAAVVVGSLVGYHLFEAYYLVPRIYGKHLRLSTLAVLLALIVGGTLQGILGAVLILPVVAAYPIIERIWLSKTLGASVLQDHKVLQNALETGNESAVNDVLEGKRPDAFAKV